MLNNTNESINQSVFLPFLLHLRLYVRYNAPLPSLIPSDPEIKLNEIIVSIGSTPLVFALALYRRRSRRNRTQYFRGDLLSSFRIRDEVVSESEDGVLILG